MRLYERPVTKEVALAKLPTAFSESRPGEEPAPASPSDDDADAMLQQIVVMLAVESRG